MTHGLRISLIVISAIGGGLAALPQALRAHFAARVRTSYVAVVGYLQTHKSATQFAILSLGLIPAIYFASWVQRYGVAVPKNDDWDVAMLISQAHSGRLSFADLVVQQQEGRTILPRLIFIASTLRGYWDVRDLMWLTVLTCVLTAGGIFHLLRKSGLSLLGLGLCLWASTLLIFTPTQFEVITFAFGFPSFLPVFFIVGAWVFNTTGASLRAKFLVGTLASLASSFTLPHGLLAWGITFPPLLLQQRVARWPRWLFAWAFVCAVAATIYFWGYRKPVDLPEFAPHIPPLDYVRFFVAFLGNAFQFATKAHFENCELFGTCTVAVFIAAATYVARHRADESLRNRTAPWFAVGFYSLGSALLATLGRVGLGLPTALSSRYVPFSIYLAIAAIALTAIIGGDLTAQIGSSSFRTWAAVCAVTCFGLGLFVYARCAADGIYFLRAGAAKDRLGRAALMFSKVMETRPVIQRTLYPRGAAWVLNTAPLLDAQKLLRPALVYDARIQTFDHEQGSSSASGTWESMDRDGHATGWAVLPEKHRPADAIVFAYSNAPGQWTAFALSDSVTVRPDIARRFSAKNQRYDMEKLWTGWSATVPHAAIPTGAKFSAWAVDTDGPKFYQLQQIEASLLP